MTATTAQIPPEVQTSELSSSHFRAQQSSSTSRTEKGPCKEEDPDRIEIDAVQEEGETGGEEEEEEEGEKEEEEEEEEEEVIVDLVNNNNNNNNINAAAQLRKAAAAAVLIKEEDDESGTDRFHFL